MKWLLIAWISQSGTDVAQLTIVKYNTKAECDKVAARVVGANPKKFNALCAPYPEDK